MRCKPGCECFVCVTDPDKPRCERDKACVLVGNHTMPCLHRNQAIQAAWDYLDGELAKRGLGIIGRIVRRIAA